jgi:hypothetical protein
MTLDFMFFVVTQTGFAPLVMSVCAMENSVASPRRGRGRRVKRQIGRLERFYAACDREVCESRKAQIPILSSETGTVRTAGIVRYELAQLLPLDDQNLESLRLHALNRELHPRFYRGRYRFAMSLEMIANPEHYRPDNKATLRKLAETLETICRFGRADRTLKKYAKSMRDAAEGEVATSPLGASWQAAYNTACLYAALADSAWRGSAPEEVLQELERRVIVALGHVLYNPQSELERAWDWISSDPDFRVMRDHQENFPAFGKFIAELKRQEISCLQDRAVRTPAQAPHRDYRCRRKTAPKCGSADFLAGSSACLREG